jgi:hypothetical protein
LNVTVAAGDFTLAGKVATRATTDSGRSGIRDLTSLIGSFARPAIVSAISGSRGDQEMAVGRPQNYRYSDTEPSALLQTSNFCETGFCAPQRIFQEAARSALYWL